MKIISIHSLYEFNISKVDHFVENIDNITLNLSGIEKITSLLDTKKYCEIHNDSLSKCIKCSEYYTNINGECVCFDRNCKSCSSSLYGACTECHAGYALSSDNTCRCKIKHCLLCDDHVCNVCERGYILSEFHTSCEFSYEYRLGYYCQDNNCNICMNPLRGACLRCKDGFNLVNGSCHLNPSEGYYFQSKMLCPDDYISIGEGCNKECLGAKCNIAENPFYSKCENNCIYCMQGILYDKLNCNMSGYCYDEKCTKCRSSEIGMCDRCELGYRLIYGRCLEQCLDINCLNCDYTMDKSCNSCKKGYLLINGKCYLKNETLTYKEYVDIYENHIMTLAENLNITYKGDGYFEIYIDNETMLLEYTGLIKEYYESKYNEICNAENCLSCLVNNPQYCMTCIDNYKPRNGQCIKCEILFCDLCLVDNECNRCQDNYILINNLCIRNIAEIKFCLKYEFDRSCSQCEDNYLLVKGLCTLNSFYTQNTSYEIMSCSDESIRNQICLKKYFYKDNACVLCRDPKCHFCYQGIGCIICEQEYNLIDGRCLKKAEFNETVSNCISYDYDGNCIECDSLCILKGGKCDCKFVNSVLTYLTIGILILIVAWIIFSLYKQETSFAEHDRIIESDMKLIEDNKINQQELQLLQEKDKSLKKCVYCRKETALFRLSCGCHYCKEDFKDVMDRLSESEINIDTEISINNIIIKKKAKPSPKLLNITNSFNSSSTTKINKKKCPSCQKYFEAYKQVAQQCEICFEITSKVFHFKCGCALTVCKNCFNRIIVNRKCPGCRKNILF